MTVINEYILTLSTGNTVTSTAVHMDAGKLSDHQLRYNVYTLSLQVMVSSALNYHLITWI